MSEQTVVTTKSTGRAQRRNDTVSFKNRRIASLGSTHTVVESRKAFEKVKDRPGVAIGWKCRKALRNRTQALRARAVIGLD